MSTNLATEHRRIAGQRDEPLCRSVTPARKDPNAVFFSRRAGRALAGPGLLVNAPSRVDLTPLNTDTGIRSIAASCTA
jgi:hypothetical protein